MEKYSLNDVAKKLGISKNAVKYRIKKLNQDFIINEDGKWFLSAEGLEEMRSIFGIEDTDTEPKSEKETGKDANSAIYEEYIATLKAEIAQKNKQLEDLQRLFNQEQQIHAQELLLLQKPQVDPEPAQTTEKKGLFGIFKKK